MKNLQLYLIILTQMFLDSSALVEFPSPGFEDTFKQCIAAHQPENDLRRCVGFGAITRLQSLDSSPAFDLLDGLTLSRDITQEYREGAYNFADLDPSDFRSIVDSFDHVFSKRAMRWDMDFIYPGLSMRISPSLSPYGLLEFVMDSNQDALNAHVVKEIGTARLIKKKLLLPVLLGLKFKIATLIPLVFGLLVLLAKKIVFVSKLALVVGSALGLGTLLFGLGTLGYLGNQGHPQQYYPPPPPDYYHGGQQYHPTTYSHPYKGYDEEYIHQSDEQVVQYRNSEPQTLDKLKLYTNVPVTYARTNEDPQQIKKGRNFAWSEAEKAVNKTPV